MMRKVRRSYFSRVVPFIAILIVLIVQAALAQRPARGQRFGNRAAVSAQQLREAGTQPVSKFAYVADQYVNLLSAYAIDSATGALTEIPGSPFPARSPRSLSADPQGRFLYTADGFDSATVSAYAIDATTGCLTEILGSPFAARSVPAAVMVDPLGRFVYVANQYDGTISAFTVSPANGALTEVAGSPFVSGSWPVGVTVAPSGKVLYVANWISGSVSAYTIDAVSGSLTEITGSPFEAGVGVFQIAITPSGQFAYAAVQGTDAVMAYSISSSSGTLTEIPGSPFSAGSAPYFVTVDPSGRFVYTANFYSNDVSGYAIDQTTGALTAIAGSPFPAGQAPGGLTTDLAGKFLYTANFGSDNSSGFAIDPTTGALTPIPDSPFATGHNPISVTTTGASGPQIPTATALVSSLNPSAYGQEVTFTAQVTSSSGTPSGTVRILYGSTAIGSGTLANGSVSIPVSSLPAGTDSITAAYQGGGGFAPSPSSPLAQTVTAATTRTSLASSLNPAGTNQSITFTASVAGQYGGTTTGSVVFSSGSQTLGTASLSGGLAALTTSFSAPGTYKISAKYSGDENNTGSTSAVLTQTILQTVSTTTTLISSLNPSGFGQEVVFTATVTSIAGTPPNGEIVTFYNGTTVFGTAPLSGGIAMLTTSSAPAGTRTITAGYGGDSTFAGSTSSPLLQVVNPALTTTGLASSHNLAAPNQKVTYTATATGQYGGAATGTVTFRDGNAVIATVTLAGNLAAYSTSYKAIGVHSITATYSGDANNVGSISSALMEHIENPSKTVVTTSGSPRFVGQAVTFTATVASIYGTIPNGELMTFYDGTLLLGSVPLVGGTAAYTTSSLSARTHTFKATYAGDVTFLPSVRRVTQVVVKYPTTTVLVSNPDPSGYGQPVTFTATVTPTGPYPPTGKVWFLDGTTGIGTATLTSGVATLTKKWLAVRTHPITAQYLGDAYSAKSTSSVLNQAVQ
jgi:6-phosphogluconolactonase (cycloisomerase 2 family)